MTTITKERFLEAFEEEWFDRIKKDKEQLLEDWVANRRKGKKWRPWTHLMLDENGFLDCVRLRLREDIPALNYYPEMYWIDAAFVEGKLFRDSIYYPLALHVLIEHELDRHVEEETWKLIFWRSPLKVLILYDYDEHMKKRKSSKEWLNEKIPVLRKMIRDTEKQRGYTDRSDYLFIVGARKSKHGDIYWRWTTDTEGKNLVTFIGE